VIFGSNTAYTVGVPLNFPKTVTVQINTNSTTPSQTTVTIGDAVTLAADETFSQTIFVPGNGNPIQLPANLVFSSTVDTSGGIPRNLTISGAAPQTVTFNGAVGNTSSLASLSSSVSTLLNGGTVKTTGGQTYSGAVTLGAATTLTSTGSGNIAFGSTL